MPSVLARAADALRMQRGLQRKQLPDAVAVPQAGINHLAIIMDGNGRWAKKRGLPRKLGHSKGAESLNALVKSCIARGIRQLTVYAFSTENWHRSPDEVQDLMQLLSRYLEEDVQKLHEHGVKVTVIGQRDRLDNAIRQQLEEIEKRTSTNHAMSIQVALSYGGRQEIIMAARKLAEAAARGEMQPEAIDEEAFSHALYTAGVPDPDLLIRTGGDYRISNFLLWQMSYTEFYFTPVLWPDFDEAELDKALSAYHKRQRRYGRREG